ncbi:hypothetical protein [Aquimarina algiphila]|uniref:Tail fiber domain-containing protein n=1 Tax=Aquimarina algiphila TaxID=2047982 RepID=A0A554VGZ3_9FLAO|nr:hypothetical protein [Aquimarina algiphila]TSE06689.1 hypothetical protein FOF46_18450 [Aquimarina algiphila]
MRKSLFLLSFLTLSYGVYSQTNTFPVDGNVGIGTLTPTEKLEVNGVIKSKSGIFEAANTQAAANSTDYRDWGKYSLALTAGRVLNTDTNGFQNRKLQFFDYSATSGGLPSGSGFTINGADGKNKLSFFNFDNGGDTRFILKSTEDKYIVQMGDYDVGRSDNNTGSDISFIQMFNPNSRIAIGTYLMYKPEHEFIVRGSGWFEQEIITDSKIGIGMQASAIPVGYKLAVAGKIISEEVKVELQSTWPDYVFKDNYDLPTLRQVENHIQEKGHLINVPSAEEIEKNGVYLGEMNARLLEKIEELTLYTIAQEKKIALQQIQIKELKEVKTKNIELEKRVEEIERLLKK